uniref:Uncharacterized protein n=1 Tax=Percolomonas cosmopolitus TaxID=63605 RepID=A0A7S1KU56_9EUKA|mmetsp:Transcript_9211/g.34025  ORF Transcript_9211/g.34025 Transcript_9211/m.34025 type:complete len:375 (+) Transcript_9211:21-1145(+)
MSSKNISSSSSSSPSLAFLTSPENTLASKELSTTTTTSETHSSSPANGSAADSSASSNGPLEKIHSKKRRESIEMNSEHGTGLNTDDQEEALLLMREARRRKVLEKKQRRMRPLDKDATNERDAKVKRDNDEYTKASALAAGDVHRVDHNIDEETQSSSHTLDDLHSSSVYSDDQISNISSTLTSAATSDLNYSLLSNENDTSSIRRRKRQRREEKPPPIEIRTIVGKTKRRRTTKKSRRHAKNTNEGSSRRRTHHATTTVTLDHSNSQSNQPGITIEQHHEVPSSPTGLASSFYARMLNFIFVLNPYGRVYSTRLEYSKEGRKNFMDFSRKLTLFVIISFGVRMLGYSLHRRWQVQNSETPVSGSITSSGASA